MTPEEQHQAQLFEQEKKLERLEDRICTVEQILQAPIVAEHWVKRHSWWIAGIMSAFSLGVSVCKLM